MKASAKYRRYIIGGILLFLLMILTSVTFSQDGDKRRMGFHQRQFFGTLLTDEQHTELREMIVGLREQDASREEIREAVTEKLNEWGIEFSENRDGFPHRGWRFKELTEEQQDTIQSKIKEMRAQGASREGVRAAIREMLNEFGIEHKGPFSQLTDEQRSVLGEKVKEMREQGAAPEEIHQAVGEMLEGWGIDLPEDWEDRPGFGRFGHGRSGLFGQLDEEQRNALHEKIQSLRDQGASRKEIRQAIKEMLDEWGIEQPTGTKGKHGRMHRNQDKKRSTPGAHTFPNPFNPETTIVFSLDNPLHVSLRIYNIQGQLIRNLVDENMPAGNHSVRWDGRYDNGVIAPAGIYVYRLDAGSQSLTGRITLMK